MGPWKRHVTKIFPALKSIRTVSTAHKVLHKNLRLHAHIVQLLKVLEPNEKLKRREFAVNMLDEFRRMKHSWSEFILVTRQPFMFQGN